MKRVKRLRSLTAKYMAIILTALFFINFLIIGTSLLVFNVYDHKDPETLQIEKAWHEDARSLKNPGSEDINRMFEKWQNRYPKARLFWVDGKGRLAAGRNLAADIPKHWNAAYTANFIKARYDNDPFTVIAFPQNDASYGFVVFEIERKLLQPAFTEVNTDFMYFIVPAGIVLFVTVSYLFFLGIRKRLLYLQHAMEIRDVDGLPVSITVRKQDEIGQLEMAFNQMVNELRESRKREEAEEQLRKELIANLSHDLRTPLTKIRAHAYTLGKEALTPLARQAVDTIEQSVSKMDRLIENLMAYTLLNAKKLKYEPAPTDVVRLARSFIATWYPVFEKEGFSIDVQLDDLEQKHWNVDPLWMERIFDNLFQNVIRHAKDGKYIGLKTERTDSYDALVVLDRGKGFRHKSSEKGAGVGLAIVDLMVKKMGLDWKIESSETGTIVKIIHYR
jgi:signal transduction histidine kinase